MTTEFSALNLQPELMQAITELGYANPMPIQSAMIPVMISGRDVIGQAQTGTGKTAAFALPILQNLDTEDRSHIQSLILAPTRELALQVCQAIVEYGQHCSVRVLAVYGGQPYGPQINQLRRGVDIVVGTPGRLIDLMNRGVLDLSKVRTVVLDEADEMLSMGFIEDIETLLSQTPPERQTALFSATLPTEIRRLADRYMNNPQSITIQREQVTGVGIEQRYYLVNETDKLAALTRLFEMEDITSALIFVRTRIATGELANELTGRGFPAEPLNGDLSQDARERTLNRFRQNKINVLVATDVAARGLDIDDISHVFNYDLPDDPEIYVHRIGRTGRAGKLGIAISLVSPFEKRQLRQVEAFARQKLNRASLPSEEDIRTSREQRLIKQVTMWLQRARYRREQELVNELIAAGHDPIAIASAALKVARAEEKQRPIAAVTEVLEPRPYANTRENGPRYGNNQRSNGFRGNDDRYGRSERNDRGSDRGERPTNSGGRSAAQAWSPVSHEPGMVRLSLKMGRRDGIRPNDIVGAIAAQANIPGNVIGKILIQDQCSFVDVPEEYVGQVLNKERDVRIRKQPLDLQRA